jgi:hypothetical protein
MIEKFGGWHGYRAAPAQILEEQRIAWLAKLKAESDRAREQQNRVEEQQRQHR